MNPSDAGGESLPERCVDAHVHLRGPESIASARQAGIFALRDAGMREHGPDARPVVASGNDPRVISAKWALYRAGGYGSRFGVPVVTPEEIRGQIAKLKQAGAAIIKVMASGIVSLKEPGRITAGGFGVEELRFIVETAAAAGLGVMAHANGEDRIIAAAEAGVRSVEHGFFMTERALKAMARNGVYWVPTAGALVRAAEASSTPHSGNFVKAAIHDHQAMIVRAHTLGVPLAIGTDCVLPDRNYAEAYKAELAYFERAGLSRDTVHLIARENGLKLLGI